MQRVLTTAILLFAAFACQPRLANAVDPLVLELEQQRINIVNKVSPAVVAIFAKGGAGGGSGVLITPDGYALTNFHVTSGSGNFMKCGLNDGVMYDAVIVGIDPTGDVALVKLLGREDFPFATMGDSDAVKVGDYTFAMGNPFLLATDFAPTVTYGIVSGVHRYQYPAGTFLEYTDCLQIDTSINPGNSGGPLFNGQGELVGINGRGSFEKRGRVNSGAGYAISINQIKHFMDHLRSGRIVDHATLGATVATRNDGAVVVTNILDASESYRRGIRQDDELVSFATRPIRSVNQFKNILGIYPKGWKLPIVYRREGQKKEVWVRLRGLHRQSELTGDSDPKPNEPKPGDPKQPKPRPGQPMKQEPPEEKPPEQYKHMFVKRAGFANYYFNELERTRILKGIAALGDFSQAQGAWKLAGTLNGKPIEITAADAGVGLTSPDPKLPSYIQQLDDSAKFGDDPPGSGGLLLAMHHLRLMCSKGKNGFSEFYYLGSEPFDGTGSPVDVLICELTGAESWWYFSRENGKLVGFDLYRNDEVDSCEIRINGFGDFSGRKLPNSVIVRNGDKEFGKLEFTGVQFLKAEEKKAESKPAESKPAESKPAESKPADAKPADKSAPPEDKP